jgi:hypothetical protein
VRAIDVEKGREESWFSISTLRSCRLHSSYLQQLPVLNLESQLVDSAAMPLAEMRNSTALSDYCLHSTDIVRPTQVRLDMRCAKLQSTSHGVMKMAAATGG